LRLTNNSTVYYFEEDIQKQRKYERLRRSNSRLHKAIEISQNNADAYLARGVTRHFARLSGAS
jgi:hypothetical protein